MKLVRVEHIPDVAATMPRIDLHDILENFLASDMKYAEVVWQPGEYTRMESARQTLQQSCKRHGFGIQVIVRGDKLYIARKD